TSGSLAIDTAPEAQAEVAPVIAELIRSSADAKDPLLPFMIWEAAEPLFAKSPEGGLNWLAEHGTETLPLSGILARKAMRRLCDMQDGAKLDLAVQFLERISTSDELAFATLDGLIEGQKAQPLLPNTNTERVFAILRTNG